MDEIDAALLDMQVTVKQHSDAPEQAFKVTVTKEYMVNNKSATVLISALDATNAVLEVENDG